MKRILIASILSILSFALNAQLSAGDLAFIGYNTDGTDDFTFITLRDIPGSTVIYLTEEGWNSVTNTWVGTTETHLVFTAPSGGLPCGTVVHINETGADAFTIGSSVSGSTISLGAGSSYTLSAGDQVLAYQATSPRPATTPTFIAGVHGDDGNGAPLTLDAITGWNDLCCTPAGVARSSVPAGLTNGVNCVSLFPSIGTEWDNAKYTGTLTGTSTVLRALINDRTNWSTDDITPYNITFGAYSPSVTCVAPCTSPTVPTVTFSPATVCAGSTATLTISGTLNDATAWHVYSGSCGGTLVGSTAGTSFVVTPGSPSTTYFVRGQGGCVVPGSCGSVTINTTALDNASFTYSASSYCVNGSDPTPTVPGPAGTFTSSPAGLSINATTGTIDVSASTAGTYTITRTTSGVCPTAATASVTITNADNASFTYSASSYCVNGSDPTPTVLGPAGTFTSSPAGLSINATTGTIDVSVSTAGTYTITRTTSGACPTTATASVTITNADNASFTYSATSYCVNGSDPTPTVPGPAGTFTSSPAGLSINATTGTIDVSASTAGTYTITRTTSGACPNTATASVTITNADNASFTYSASSYCVNGSDPTPTVPGPAGTFTSSPAGLSINATTGTIDVSASTAGTYTITRTTSGACPNTATASVTITNADNASFTYSASSYCVNGSDPTPTVPGPAGTFTSSPAGLSINATTGTIDVSASTAGTYTITRTTSGACPNTATATIVVTNLDNASFSYSLATYCPNSVDPSPIITGVLGGVFSSSPSGLTINSSTGLIDISSSIENTYTITYTTVGLCSNSSNQTVTIDDVTPPITPTLAAINAECSVTPSAPTTTDNCAGTITGTTVTTFPISVQGTTVVTWVFNDGNGNTTTATQSVIIDDVTPPITPILAAINAECSVTPSAPTTIDICAGTIIGTTVTTFPISVQGTTVVTWVFNDGNGNTTTATQSVIIDDVTPPITPILAAINAECSVTPSAPTTTDNCAGTITGTTVTTFPISVQGTTVVTWIFDDGNGNTTSATQDVIIDDVTPPVVIDCPSTITSAVNNSGCTAIVNWISPTSNDNCTVFPSIISSHIPGDIFPVGTTNVSYIFNDGNGNTASCSFDVIVSSPIVLNAVGTDVTCNGQSDAQIDLTVSGGTNPYTFDWNSGLFSTEDITALNAGTYSVIVEDINNCSASTSVTITEPSAIEYAQSSTICFGESFTVGTNNYTTSGIYIDVLPAANGCDSTITTNLTVTSEIDITTLLDETSLISNQNGALYQWIDCNNGNAPIGGANNQVFSPLANGSYAVIVTSGSCSDTSECTTVATIGIAENTNDALIGIYPNPNNGQFIIELAENSLVEITDILGKQVFKSNLQKGSNQLSLSHIETGVYFVTIITGGKQMSVKIVKE